MIDLTKQNNTTKQEEKKSRGQQDYEAGQEFLENNDIVQAANSFHNAMIGFEQEDNEIGIANSADKLGDICVKRQEFKKALVHYDRSYKICHKSMDLFSMFSLEKKKAKLFYDIKEYDKSITMYLDILDEYGRLLNPQGSVDTLETLAKIYTKIDAQEKAADAYRMAASIHQKFKHTKHAEELLQKATEILK